MARTIFYLLAGLGGGLAIAVIWSSYAEKPDFDDLALPGSLNDRVAALERDLDRERRERARLDAEVEMLRAGLDQLGESAAGDGAQSVAEAGSEGRELPSAGDEPNEREFPARVAGRRNSAEDRIERLVGAGFSLDQAEWIERRTEELRVEAMQARYDAIREGGPGAAIDALPIEAGLRAELGDADYERYLEASGRPTRVTVSSVLASSAAEQAGMQPGDEIYSYGGERVFDTRDLNQALLAGEPGEPVIVEVLRDGQQLQLVVPRGPVGITSGRFGGRRGLSR